MKRLILPTAGALLAVMLFLAALSGAQAQGPANFPNCRLGIGGAASPVISNYNIAQLNMGLYLDWSARANPAQEIGLAPEVEYLNTVRVHQFKDCGTHCIGSYVQPPAYTVSPNLTELARRVAANPGALWRIGNEIERIDWADGGQDEITPELYATAFHEVQQVIKSTDPTARVAIGSVILASQFRLTYLDRVWAAHQAQYGYPMGDDIDVWIFHVFLLPEVRGWGAEIPAGFDNGDADPTNDYNPADGYLYGLSINDAVHEQHNLNEFKANVVRFRQWMADHGQQNKPLINTEFGVLFPNGWGDITTQVVKDYMTGAFDHLFSAADPALGYPQDEYRLVQGWVWYSLEDTYWNGSLFNPSTFQLSEYGLHWRSYVTDSAHPLASQPQQNLRVANLRADPNPAHVAPDDTFTVTLSADIFNNGNTRTATGNAIQVQFWNGEPGTPGAQPIGGPQMLPDIPGCARFATASVEWAAGEGNHHWFVQVTPLPGELKTSDNITGSTLSVLGDGPAIADVSLQKIAGNATPVSGGSVTFTLTATNAGPHSAHNVVVAEHLPPGLAADHALTSRGVYSTATRRWDIGTLAAGQVETLLLTAQVLPGFGGQALTNTAAISAAYEVDPTPANNFASAVITPQAAADLSLGKQVSNPAPFSGDTVRYTLTATNFGPDPATAVTVTDTLPAGVTFVQSNASQGSYSTGNGVWAAGALAVGESAALTLTVSVDAGWAGQTITNLATVSGAELDLFPANNSAAAGITPQRRADLSIGQQVNTPTPYSGDTITFSLTVTNAGPDAAVQASAAETLPAGLALLSTTTSHGSYAAGVWSIGGLAVAESARLTLTAQVEPNFGGQSLTSSATVQSPASDPNPANNSAAVSVIPAAKADVGLFTSVSGGGNSVLFSLRVRNFGPDSAVNVHVSQFLLPDGLIYQSHVAGNGVYSPTTGIWQIGDLPAGPDTVLTLSAEAAAGSNGQTFVIDNITVSAAGFDPELTNNSGSLAAEIRTVNVFLPVIIK